MSLGKLPALKSLMSGNHQKRRQRQDLTLDMIGPPMGDFRHTMHVGRGGEAFGDTSFLSDHGGPAAESPSKGGFFARTLRHVRKSPLRGRGGSVRSETVPATYPPPPVSPIIKNAVSLPQLNEIANGGAERFTYKSAPINNMSGNMYPYGLESGFCTIPRLSRQEKTTETTYQPEESEESDTEAELGPEVCDSLQSFHLDFGPSLMSEVLGGFGLSASIAEEDEDEEEDVWENSPRINQWGVMTNGHAAQTRDMGRERCELEVAHNEKQWVSTNHTEDTGDNRVNGLSRLVAPTIDIASVAKPTPSPRGQRALWQNEIHDQERAREHAGPDYQVDTTPQAYPMPTSEGGARAGQLSGVSRVLAHHYGGTPDTACDEEEVDGPRQEEVDTGTQAPVAQCSRVYIALQGGSFTYAEEEEDDDEVKV
ncbi:cdc42 effector protein 1 [Ambystoma mexicanum]|uniref:cdc42 effector protein 1 n=1 Tax=Ambystoma mexicanum TaxID=8296 RepID=UPI0037E7CD0D